MRKVVYTHPRSRATGVQNAEAMPITSNSRRATLPESGRPGDRRAACYKSAVVSPSSSPRPPSLSPSSPPSAPLLAHARPVVESTRWKGSWKLAGLSSVRLRTVTVAQCSHVGTQARYVLLSSSVHVTRIHHQPKHHAALPVTIHRALRCQPLSSAPLPPPPRYQPV